MDLHPGSPPSPGSWFSVTDAATAYEQTPPPYHYPPCTQAFHMVGELCRTFLPPFLPDSCLLTCLLACGPTGQLVLACLVVPISGSMHSCHISVCLASRVAIIFNLTEHSHVSLCRCFRRSRGFHLPRKHVSTGQLQSADCATTRFYTVSLFVCTLKQKPRRYTLHTATLATTRLCSAKPLCTRAHPQPHVCRSASPLCAYPPPAASPQP